MLKSTLHQIAALCLFATTMSSASAQIPFSCGTDARLAGFQTDPAYRIREAEIGRNYRESMSQSRTGAATYVVPTVVHIVQQIPDTSISDFRVQEQIAVLNEDFRLMNADTSIIPPIFAPYAADTDIEFRLATIDPHGCPTNGINRVTSPLAFLDWDFGPVLKRATQWNPHMYMNIWVVESINNNTMAGYAINPNYLAIDSSLDGIVLGTIYFGRGYTSPITPSQLGRTLTHEVGHYLGLHHTFYGGCAGTSPSDCMSAGDEVCDTPALVTPSTGCNNAPNGCTETPTDLPDQVYNHMDYTIEACRVMFTQGQADRMHFYLNGIRASLNTPANLAATGCDGTVSPGCMPRASFSSSARYVCPGDSVYFQDTSPGSPATWTWSFPGGIPANSTLQNPAVHYPQPGVYLVTLEVTNGFGSSIFTDTTYIHADVSNPPPLAESFEGPGGIPAGWYVRDGDGLGTWQVSTAAASIGVQSMYQTNYGVYYNRTTDDLVSTPIDLSGLGAGWLAYDLAYRRYNSFNQDTLFVQVSTDCGHTWNTEWTGAGNSLATVPGIQVGSPFVPATSQWRRDSIDLSPYLGHSDLRIRFRAKGLGGQDIYLDRINIDGIVAGTRPPLSVSPFSVVSPIRESIDVQCHLEWPADLDFILFDAKGMVLLRESVRVDAAGNQRIRLWNGIVGGLPHGVYFLRMQSDEGMAMRKVVR